MTDPLPPHILALDQPAREASACHQPQEDVLLQWAEERDALADEHRHMRHDEAVDEAIVANEYSFTVDGNRFG